jgi:DNA replication protein DnaC
MSLQSERIQAHFQRLRLTYVGQCYESLAEEAAQKNLPYLDFLEKLLEAESQAKYERNVKLKTQWAHFPYRKRLEQFDFGFQPSVDEKKIRELASLRFLEHQENVILLGPPGGWARRTWRLPWELKPSCTVSACTSLPCRTCWGNWHAAGRRTS